MQTNDLGNLLSLYAEWHSHLIPYYSFNQFVHKVEQVGATKRVKVKYFLIVISCNFEMKHITCCYHMYVLSLSLKGLISF